MNKLKLYTFADDLFYYKKKYQTQLKNTKNTFCIPCGCADPINSWGVCFLCGKIPKFTTIKGLKLIIKGFIKWHTHKLINTIRTICLNKFSLNYKITVEAIKS